MVNSTQRINWKDWFIYCPNGTLLWKVDRESGNGKIQSRAGSIAGGVEVNGYIVVGLGGLKYKAHRIIWEMHFGDIPKGHQIDHINGIRNDNRIENLRLVTHCINGRNQKLRSTNTTGKTGVTKFIRNGKEYYQARWRDIDGNEKSKTFSLEKYDDAFDRACEFRERMIYFLNLNGAGYHPLHGNK